MANRTKGYTVKLNVKTIYPYCSANTYNNPLGSAQKSVNLPVYNDISDIEVLSTQDDAIKAENVIREDLFIPLLKDLTSERLNELLCGRERNSFLHMVSKIDNWYLLNYVFATTPQKVIDRRYEVFYSADRTHCLDDLSNKEALEARKISLTHDFETIKNKLEVVLQKLANLN